LKWPGLKPGCPKNVLESHLILALAQAKRVGPACYVFALDSRAGQNVPKRAESRPSPVPPDRPGLPDTAMHLGILKVDSVREEFVADHGDYPEMFEQLLLSADPSMQISVFDVQSGDVPEVSQCDGYVITGSRDSVYDDLPWIPPLVDFVGQLRAQEIKLAAICFGHQLIAHFFGGRVGAAEEGWAVGVHSCRIVEHNHWMTPPGEQLSLLSSHKDQVLELPHDATLYATNDFCPYAGFTVGNHTLTIQGHPEFRKEYARSLMTFRKDLLGETVFNAGLDSLSGSVDQSLMGRWLVNFFVGTNQAEVGK